MAKLGRSLAIVVSVLALAITTVVHAQEDQQQKQRLFMKGARLWPVYCAQCHKARPSSEFSPDQWKTITMHMRSRANMPAEDAGAILEYLQRSR